MALPAGKARVGVRARIQSQAGARHRRSHINQTVRDCEDQPTNQTVRDSTNKIVWKEEDDQAWETVSEPGGVDQQLLFVRHTKDETEGEQQQGGGTLGEQVSNSWGDQTVPHSYSF